MKNLHKTIASWFGIGFIKGGGTIAALVTCPLIYAIWQKPAGQNDWGLFLFTLAITLVGIFSGDEVEPDWGKDSSRVVIDEVAGMLIAILFLPHNIYVLAGGLLLFRFFDILKPLGIRKMEALKGGTGVMADDVLAGVYSNLVLQLAALIFHLR
ncbi:phosphatidylglycerophosphatase A [Mucilaginibacter yixingensis]|uniref:phosphatidylglycerophosphatase A family protein n=1 Tax=Mucilaginibacter yixingensis TaxID=1295612 RepID=UPI000D302B86|nr:phosphatidylglycerophosphatase A [Mucilaginibacter yixingensis]